jgi:lysophospholipase L1-like esterase
MATLVFSAPAAWAREPAVGIVSNPCARQKTMKEASGRAAWHRHLYAVDFGRLCRYRAADQKLPPPDPNKPRVIFMGDSITKRWKDRDPSFFTDGRIDRGISGQTTPQMLVRFRQDVIDLKPAVVHIMAGTNDIAGNTGPTTLKTVEGNVASMAELAKAHGVKVILASVPPAKQFPWRPRINPVPEIGAIDHWLKVYAAKHDYTYVNYFSALAGPNKGMKPGLSSDGVHPTKKGYAVMEPLTLVAIRKALAM